MKVLFESQKLQIKTEKLNSIAEANRKDELKVGPLLKHPHGKHQMCPYKGKI